MRLVAFVVACALVGCTPSTEESPDSGNVPSDAGAQWAQDAGPGYKPSGDAGLLWPDGIEPGDPSQCEAPAGKRCWWVDADAPDGGDGSFASPYNSFEAVGGYVDAALQGFIVGQISGGDFLYVRGTFHGDQSVEEGKKTTLTLARAEQGGTVTAPTVIKSWRGSPRAVFDGNLVTQDDLISIGRAPYVRLQNVEVSRAGGRGIMVADGVIGMEIVSVYVHDGVGAGNSGVGGGVMLTFWDDLRHDYVVRNSVFVNNKQQRNGVDGNIGGLSVLGEPQNADRGGVRIFNNIFEDEITAIRQKHTAEYSLEAYGNVFRRCAVAFTLRSTLNDYHHNVVIDTDVGVAHDAWNYNIPTTTGHFRNNTFYNVKSLLELSMEYPTSPGFQVVRTFDFTDNILVNTGTQTAAMVSFTDSNGVITANTRITLGNNTLWYTPQSTPFVSIPVEQTTHDFAWAMANYAGTGTSFADPLFKDAANEDFSLLPGSPAIGTATDSGNRGAR